MKVKIIRDGRSYKNRGVGISFFDVKKDDIIDVDYNTCKRLVDVGLAIYCDGANADVGTVDNTDSVQQQPEVPSDNVKAEYTTSKKRGRPKKY